MGGLTSLILLLLFLFWLPGKVGRLFPGSKKMRAAQNKSATDSVVWKIVFHVIPVLGILNFLAEAFKKGWTEGDESQGQTATTGMSKDEARRILGVDPNASKQDIKDAYKRLMMRNHPDGGGTDGLAQQINQARDALLKR